MARRNRTDITIDASEVYAMLKRLGPKEMKKVHRGALRRASKIVQKTAINTLRGEIGNESINKFDWWNNGIKSDYKMKKIQTIFAKVNKDATSTAIRIPYFFATKLFETGARNRYTKKGEYRGDFEPNHFFTEALDASEDKAVEELHKYIEKGIVKQYNSKQ